METEFWRDTWGVPHVRAESHESLAHGQGLVTARDRAWQLEVERHRVEGTSASFLGPSAVAWDRFVRRARLAETARRCFAALDQDTAAWVSAYAAGVNAGLAEGARATPEFASVALEPGRWHPWTPLGIWLSAHILFAGFPAKLWRTEAAGRLGEDAVTLFATDGPGTAGSNGWLVPGDRTATGSALLAGDPHRFIEAPGVYQQVRLACPEYDVVGLAVPGVPGIAHFAHTGSVAWSITNSMADYQDLYRERLRHGGPTGVQALGPDGWTPAHCHTEVIEVAGAAPVEVDVVETERGPVILDAPADNRRGGPDGPEGPDRPQGANRPSGPDSPDGPDLASPDGRAFARPEGPGVAHSDGPARAHPDGPVESTAVSLRHLPRVRADLGFRALPALLRARCVADVDRALDDWVEPVNVVQAADTTGGLLHRVAGAVPVRDRAARLGVVVAHDARHAWRDALEPTPRATVTGPAVMANARGIATPLGIEFAAPHRDRRIRELLRDTPAGGWAVEHMAAIHTDTLLASAAPLLTAVAALSTARDPDAAEPGTRALSEGASALRGQLLDWGGRMDAGSSKAAAYARVRADVVRRVAAHPRLAPLAGIPTYPEPFAPWLELVPRVAYALESLLTSDLLPPRDRSALVAEALEAVAASGGTGGHTGTPSDIGGSAAAADGAETPSEPLWGDTHRLVCWQALPDVTDKDLPGLGGDHDCVLSTSSVPGLTDLSARGPAARYVWDLHRRDDSRWIVPFGTSGVPGSAHHRDQLPLWLRGDLVPVTTDWALLTKESSVTPPAPPVPLTFAAGPRGPYEREVAGFGTVRVAPVDPERDAGLLHSWVDQERARFWGMRGTTRDGVRDIYAHMATLTTHHAHLVHRDGIPVALLQTYEPAADRVSACYEAEPGDVGIHLLIGPPPEGRAERGFSAALISVFVDFVLADPAHHRIVTEPDIENDKAVARLVRSGFEPGPEVVLPEVDLPDVFLPEKRARLLLMSREAASARPGEGGTVQGRDPDAAAGPTTPGSAGRVRTAGRA
ncbi:GNAT family N-acetyltransferase [Streptomyces sp. NBC_01497]|uniref:GNAT family N-acetyltransferase n=1 Tax=Streptomyces sp. NBC_01497 TaxID=2903885 RepID=UPI002E35EFD6|nr:GNAT family N-acetyltransferase [Streptomyces sp. NBC_01497]